MIVLDTHVWIWWMHNDPALPPAYKHFLDTHKSAGLGVSIISCWEIALLDAGGNITLPSPIETGLNHCTGSAAHAPT